MRKGFDFNKAVEQTARVIANWFAKEYGMSREEALILFKQSRTFALMRDPKTGYAYGGDVSLYYAFRREYDDQHMTGEPVLDDNTPHKGLLQWMMSVYSKAKSNNFEWHPLYLNNMPGNGVAGTYTDMYFVRDGHFQYVRFTIEYVARCDKNGISHPEEGVKYYVLHMVDLIDQDTADDYGIFRYVFDDKKTAKKVIVNELLQMIYPFTLILTYEEKRYWNWFVKSFEK